MARDGLFFRRVGELNEKHLPAWGLIIQGIWGGAPLLPPPAKIYSGCTVNYRNSSERKRKGERPMANLFARIPLDKLMYEAAEVVEHRLKRSLWPFILVALCIGAIIGAGLFFFLKDAAPPGSSPFSLHAFIPT